MKHQRKTEGWHRPPSKVLKNKRKANGKQGVGTGGPPKYCKNKRKTVGWRRGAPKVLKNQRKTGGGLLENPKV